MDLQSDYDRIKDLLRTDEMMTVEFSERSPQRGNNQIGGDDNLDYLDDFSSAQYNKNRDMKSYEKDFYEIFRKAKEYRDNMSGGQRKKSSDRTGKKELSPALRLMLDMTSNIKSVKGVQTINPECKHINFIQVSKRIVDDLKKKYDVDQLTDEMQEEALSISKEMPREYREFLRNLDCSKKPRNKKSGEDRFTSNRRREDRSAVNRRNNGRSMTGGRNGLNGDFDAPLSDQDINLERMDDGPQSDIIDDIRRDTQDQLPSVRRQDDMFRMNGGDRYDDDMFGMNRNVRDEDASRINRRDRDDDMFRVNRRDEDDDIFRTNSFY